MELSYIKGACGISRWDLESNENVYESFGMIATMKGSQLWGGDLSG